MHSPNDDLTDIQIYLNRLDSKMNEVLARQIDLDTLLSEMFEDQETHTEEEHEDESGLPF